MTPPEETNPTATPPSTTPPLPPPPSRPDQPAGSPKRRWRWSRRIPLIILVALILLIALAPTLLSSGIGTSLVTRVANSYIGGKGRVKLNELSIGWFSSQHIEGLTLDDEQGKPIVQVGQLTLPDRSILSLARDYQNLGTISGRDITVDLVQYEDGTTNLQRALQASQPAGAGKGKPTSKPTAPTTGGAAIAMSTQLQLANIHISLTSPGVEPVTVDLPTLQMKMDGSRLDMKIDATVAQGGNSGGLKAEGGLTDLESTNPKADIRAVLDALPVAAIDQMLKLSGKLVALLGERLDGGLTVKGDATNADMLLSVESSALTANVPLHVSAQTISSTGEAAISLKVTPKAYAAWSSGQGELKSPVTLTMKLANVDLPMVNGRPDVSKLKARVDLATDAASLNFPGVGDVRMESLAGRIDVDRVSDFAAVKLAGPFSINNQPGHLDLDASVGGLSGAGGRELNIKLTDAPVPIVDNLAHLNGAATALLGTTVTITAQGRYPGDLDIAARSANVSLDAPLRLSAAAYSLRAPPQAQLTLNPTAQRLILGEAAGSLLSPVTINLAVSEAVVPLVDGQPDRTKIRATGELRTSAIAMSVPNVGNVNLDGIVGTLAADAASDTATLALQSALSINGSPGRLDAAATVRGLSQGKYDIDASLSDLPVPIIDQLARLDGKALALLGPTAKLTVRGKYPGDLDVALDSSGVSLDAPLRCADDAISLRNAGHVQAVISPAAYSALIGPSAGTLAAPVTVNLDINDAYVPLLDGKPNALQARANADLHATVISMNLPGVGDIRVDSLTGALATDGKADTAAITLRSPISIHGTAGNLNIAAKIGGLTAGKAHDLNAQLDDVPVPLVDQLAQLGGKATTLLGAAASLSVKGQYPGNLDVSIQSVNLTADAPLSITDTAIALRSAGHVQATITPAAYQLFAGPSTAGGPSELAAPVTVKIDLKEANLPMLDGKPQLLKATAGADISATAINATLPSVGAVKLDALAGTVAVDGPKGLAAVTLRSPMAVGEVTGNLNVDASVGGLNSALSSAGAAGGTYDLNVKLADVPVALVDQLAQLAGKATALVGPTATLTAKGRYPGDLDVSLHGATATLDAPLRITEAAYALRGPAHGELKFQPGDYRVLFGQQAGTLADRVTITLDVADATVPRVDGKVDLMKSRAHASLNATPMTLTLPPAAAGAKPEQLKLDNLAGTLAADSSPSGAQNIVIKLTSPMSVGDESGNLDVAATIGRPVAPAPAASAAAPPPTAPYTLDLSLTNVPMAVVDQFAHLSGKGTALVGPVATVTAKGDYPGDVQVAVRSRSVQADAPLHADADALTLTGDLNAQVSLERDSARVIMGQMHPIVADVVASKKPIHLLIRQEGFTVPLKDYSFEKVRAQGTLDLGQMEMTRRGWMQLMMDGIAGALGQPGSQQSQTYLADFTPTGFNVGQGRIRSDQLWMTSDRLAVGFVGRTDVPANKYDYTIGLLGATLIAQVPQIGKAIAPDEIVEMPLRGSLDKPTPDFGPLVKQLLTKVAVNQAGGGETGQAIGALGQLLGQLEQQKKGGTTGQIEWTPPPAAVQFAASMKSQQPSQQPSQVQPSQPQPPPPAEQTNPPQQPPAAGQNPQQRTPARELSPEERQQRRQEREERRRQQQQQPTQ